MMTGRISYLLLLAYFLLTMSGLFTPLALRDEVYHFCRSVARHVVQIFFDPKDKQGGNGD